MPNAMHSANELFYIGIKHKNELRRAILESSKEMIQALKAYRRIKEMEAQHAERLHDLNHIMADIRKLDNKLRMQLPKVAVPKKGSKPVPHHIALQQAIADSKAVISSKTTQALQKTSLAQNTQNTQNAQEKSAITKPAKLSEVEKLEKELAEIEDKLKMIR